MFAIDDAAAAAYLWCPDASARKHCDLLLTSIKSLLHKLLRRHCQLNTDSLGWVIEPNITCHGHSTKFGLQGVLDDIQMHMGQKRLADKRAQKKKR